ncbi:hypothetical protein LOZ65_000573 [Ophidiomyces ophidiicola]|nr:hypothetical protein LOZ65_000573 [Ophidiomyces ophidiicola]
MAAFVVAGSIPWHEGEKKLHTLMRVPYEDNPTVSGLRPGGGYFVQTTPLIAIGTLDKDGLPWTTVLGGLAGFAGEIAPSIVALRNTVDKAYDPVLEALLNGKCDGELVKFDDAGGLMAALPIDLENRRRLKLMGRMVVACLNKIDQEGISENAGAAQLVFKVTESLGNCPKYLNKKHIIPAQPNPKLISDSPQLTEDSIGLLNRVDTLFISTSHHTNSMDTNIRGGAPGFVRVISNNPEGAVLVYPEYSGNRLYQSLGNLETTPRAGLVFPDFENGNVLYTTGVTEVLVGKNAAALLPRSNLAVKFTLTAARYVETGLSFRGQIGELSPYNPSIRYLLTEKETPSARPVDNRGTVATLTGKEIITSSITRFRFQVSEASFLDKLLPGQYATFSFRDELDMGYSHMKDDDPTSINDDFIRTFTVSSHPGRHLSKNELEIMVRKHGRVTSHLFRSSERCRLTVPLVGLGGDFHLPTYAADGRLVPYIAGGIGITPIISQLHTIDISRFQLYWSIKVQDIALAQDIFAQFPDLAGSTILYITGSAGDAGEIESILTAITELGAKVHKRRLSVQDLRIDEAEKWYLCAGSGLRRAALNWLSGKKVIYEDFEY